MSTLVNVIWRGRDRPAESFSYSGAMVLHGPHQSAWTANGVRAWRWGGGAHVQSITTILEVLRRSASWAGDVISTVLDIVLKVGGIGVCGRFCVAVSKSCSGRRAKANMRQRKSTRQNVCQTISGECCEVQTPY